jgi:septal ring factor EnvC (AmiA/AmiB activator)
MSKDEDTPSFFGRFRECFAALKELIIVLVIVLLFLWPPFVGRTLYAAGISSLFGIDFDVDRLIAASESAEQAGEELSKVNSELRQVNTRLTTLAQTPQRNPQAVKDLSDEAKRLETRSDEAMRRLEMSRDLRKSVTDRLPIRQPQRRLQPPTSAPKPMPRPGGTD